jgi:putative oxidoreductase
MFKNRRSRIANSQLMDDVYSSGLKPQGDPLVPQRAAEWNPEYSSQAAAPRWNAPHENGRRARSALETAAHLAGRAIFGGYFVYNGINHFKNRETVAAYASSKKVPAADAAVVASGLMMLAGGISLLAGTRPKIGAASIAGFLIGVSPTMHAYWNETDPQQRMNETVNFMKNMALVGGTLLAAGHPEPWPVSIRA